MASQELQQLHLTNKIEHAAVLDKDGKTVKTAAHTETTVGFSNRAVRFRTLDPDELDAIQLDAARASGEEAKGAEIYTLALSYCLWTMVCEYSEPTDTPLDKKTKWTAAKFAGFFAGSPKWSSIFTAKDTALLRAVYRKWHEVPTAQIEMLAGKALAVAPTD